MSFSFAVGGFAALFKLAQATITLVQDSGVAREEYQQLVRELEHLKAILLELDRLQSSGPGPTPNFERIKYAAMDCQRPLEQFLEKSQKFSGSLGLWAPSNLFRNAKASVQWALTRKREVAKLQQYMTARIGTILLLFAKQTLEMSKQAFSESAARQLQMQQSLDLLCAGFTPMGPRADEGRLADAGRAQDDSHSPGEVPQTSEMYPFYDYRHGEGSQDILAKASSPPFDFGSSDNDIPRSEMPPSIDPDDLMNIVLLIEDLFPDQPEKLNEFQDILTKPVQDLHSQVSILFNSAPDIFEAFKLLVPALAANTEIDNAEATSTESDQAASDVDTMDTQ